MMFEEALYTHLKDNPDVRNLVADKVYPLVLPQNCKLPAVTYQKVSAVRLHDLQGDAGYTMQVFQISCWAQSYAQLKDLGQKVRLSLQNFSGLMGGSQGVLVSAVLLQSETEGYEPDTKAYYVHFDFEFHYNEPV